MATACGKSKRARDSGSHAPPAGGTSSDGGSSGMNAEAGAATTDAGGPSAPGCFVGGTHFDEGATWELACNTCRCLDADVLCTVNDCGTGGSAGTSAGVGGAPSGGAGGGGAAAGTAGMASAVGGAGAGNGGGAGSAAGMAGGAGTAAACGPAEVGSFCILGEPTEDARVSLSAGMPLTLAIVTSGCVGTNCTDEVVRADCTNTLGSPTEFWLTPDICLTSLGDRCSKDCTGTATVSCDVGDPLAEGDYAVGIGGGALQVHFSVPSVVFPDELCAPPVRPEP